MRGADQREVRQGLREVAQQLARCADLLGVQAEVVGVGEHLLKGQARLVETAGTGSASTNRTSTS